MDAIYTRFSDEEFVRRYDAVRAMMDAEGLDALVVFGWSAMGRAVQADVHYLSGYLGMRDNYVVFPAEGDPTLLVQSYNHVPNAADAASVDDVRWGGDDSGATVGAQLRDLGARAVGVVGMMPYQHHASMRDAAGEVTFRDVTRPFRRLRTIKSDEEIAWLRRGAEATDVALEALRAGLRPGVRERELGEIVGAAGSAGGAIPVFHYISSTPMDAPERCVPSQVLSEREIRAGDVVTVEVSVAYHGYAGQGLRTFVVDAEPTPLFAGLHECAERVFDDLARAVRPGAGLEEVLAAGDLVVSEGYTIRDAVLHGFGIGLLPPIIGTRETPHANDPWTFTERQTVVVQPNVVTRDEVAGVQTGELCVVTPDGLESLHTFPRELVRV